MLLEEFSTQSTLNGVAQAVVDKVVRMHHDTYMKDNQVPKKFQNRADITLLVCMGLLKPFLISPFKVIKSNKLKPSDFTF